jgi:ABC-type lipoprotein release transport system permease subunit
MMFFKLAWRNIWRNKRRTLITVSAIVFAVLAAVFMQSMNRGSHEMMIDNMVRFHTGYVQIQDFRYKEESSLDNSFQFSENLEHALLIMQPRIEQIIPRLETYMLAGNDHATRGAFVLGINPDREHDLNGIRNHISEGRFFEAGEQKAVITEGLAKRLELKPGDQLLLIGQGRFGMSANALVEISGILRHPIREMNNQTVYLPLEKAQFILSAEEFVTSILLVPERERHSKQIASNIKQQFTEHELKAYLWPELIPELLQLLEFDLVGAYFMSAILYLVIGFGFFGTVLTMTLERLHEFGVLISVGMKRSKLAMVILLETIFISVIGVILGIILSYLLLLYFHFNPIELTGDIAEMIVEMGWEAYLPMSFAADQFYMQGLIVFIIAMLVFLFPMIKVLKINVLEAMRY